MIMLRYAASHNGVRWSRIRVIDAGTPEQMSEAFRAGRADCVHLQGPASQQLEHDRTGYIVASVGQAMPPVAFSSVPTSREFLQTQACQAFLRAFASAKEWVRQATPEEVAAKEASFFPGIDIAVLAPAV